MAAATAVASVKNNAESASSPAPSPQQAARRPQSLSPSSRSPPPRPLPPFANSANADGQPSLPPSLPQGTESTRGGPTPAAPRTRSASVHSGVVADRTGHIRSGRIRTDTTRTGSVCTGSVCTHHACPIHVFNGHVGCGLIRATTLHAVVAAAATPRCAGGDVPRVLAPGPFAGAAAAAAAVAPPLYPGLLFVASGGTHPQRQQLGMRVLRTTTPDCSSNATTRRRLPVPTLEAQNSCTRPSTALAENETPHWRRLQS